MQFRFRQRRQLIELPVTEGLATNDTCVLRRAVIEGGGIGILPAYLVGKDLKRGRLVRVLPTVEPERWVAVMKCIVRALARPPTHSVRQGTSVSSPGDIAMPVQTISGNATSTTGK